MILEDYQYSDGDTVLRGYLGYDQAAKGPCPGVLVAPEAPGLGDHVKKRVAMFAEAGFVALGADVYGEGRYFDDMEQMMPRVEATRSDIPAWRQRMKAGLDALAVHERVDAGRLCAVGYCFGGTGVLELARSGADLAAVVCFHGELHKTPHAASGIKARILVFNGADDPFVPAQDRLAFEAEMTAAAVDWQMVVYGGVKHGWTNPASDQAPVDGMAYDAVIDRRSWHAMLEWLRETL